jgi:signal transduction histidine kinase
MQKLYFRIYLAVLGSLLVFALLAGLAFALVRTLEDEEPFRWLDMGGEIAERLFPDDRGKGRLASELEFWHERTGFSLMMLAPSGQVLAQAGEFPGDVGRQLRRGSSAGAVWRGKRGIIGLTLQDGRQLIAFRPGRGLGALRHLRWLAALLGIGLAVGICAYPVVRTLTRRIERLQRGVAAFGAGDLSVRIAIGGRDEIARLAETFNASAARIEALLTSHKTLLANASHELRSPLTRLRMAVEGMAGAGGSAPARAEIAKNIEELDALVDEILLASRLQADAAYELKMEPVDLVGLLAEACAAHGADLSAESGQIPTVNADARLLRRLFRNLLDNAALHGGGQPAEVMVRKGVTEAEIDVCDRGPGIPEAERERIFEPFYRVKNVPESAGGAGLGLALAKQIAERHGGSIACLPRIGGGSCFRVRLPLAADLAAQAG